MIYQTGNNNTKNLSVTATNPLSPRVNDSFKQYIMSSDKNSNLRKNSKVMKKYYEEAKSYRSSRNLDSSKGIKMSTTQLAALPASSRNTSSNVNIMLGNMSSTTRAKKSLKHSMTSK
jgi:hypothetical protein